MTNLTSSVFLCSFIILLLAHQHLAVRALRKLDQTKIDKRYDIYQKAEVGRWYDTWKGTTKEGENLVLMKTAKSNEDAIQNEIDIYLHIYSRYGGNNALIRNMLNMLDFGIYNGKKAIITDLPGDDFMKLSTVNGQNKGPEYFRTVCRSAQDVIFALQFIHRWGIVHCDIRPENIAEGTEEDSEFFNSTERNNVALKKHAYLFNFRLARSFQYENGTVMERMQNPYSVTFGHHPSPYSSRYAMEGYTQYPCDDMEALGYAMLTITAGSLPWAYFAIDELEDKGELVRSAETLEEVCKGMGLVDMGMINVFKNYFRLLHNLYFATDNGYKLLINYEELAACFKYPA